MALLESFMGIRFIVSPDGTYHFLEVNPAGQWLWLERAIDLNISESIADALIKRE